MTDKAAIRELREKVEAGKWIVHAGRAVFGSEMHPYWQAYQAYTGSLDAALALHEAVLPGWAIEIKTYLNWNINAVVLIPVEDGTKYYSASGEPPARAWLIAILKAMEND